MMADDRRMLVVDDESVIVFALKEYFTANGFRVDGAQELEPARDLVGEHEYDVVIADLQLTVRGSREGLTLAKHVRSSWPNAAILLLTAYVTDDLAAAARDHGVDLVLQKPQPLSELARVVTDLTERRTVKE